MKTILLSLFVMAFTLNTTAQITITQADMSINLLGDITNISLIDMFVPEEGADMVWDFTGMATYNNSSFVTYPNNNSNFPNANLRRNWNFNIFNNNFPANMYYKYDATGYGRVAFETFETKLPLIGLTGNSADTLHILGSDLEYSSPIYDIKFPCNYNDSEIKTVQDTFQYVINAAASGLVDYEVKQVQKTSIGYIVNGWGVVVLQNPNTMMNDSFDVLLIKNTLIQVDSFYDVNDNSILGALLTSFGLAQGQTQTREISTFYVKGLNGYAFQFLEENGVFINARYNRNIFDTHTVGTNVATKPNHIAHAVFPNPIQNHQFQIEFEKTSSKDWTFEMVNVLGQSVHQEMFSEGETTVRKTIRLDSSLSKGAYFYAVRNEDGQVIANGRVIL